MRGAPYVYGFGWLDLGDLVRPRENVCVYATTFVRSKRGDARPATLWAGASGSFKLFWNGTEVLTDLAYRSLDADRFAVPITLAKGWNRLLAKVCGDDDSPMLSVRLADAKGAPDASLEFTADPSVSAEAAKNAASAKKPGHASSKLLGPVPAFQPLVAAKSPNPHMLEAYARYLELTGGDDPAQHFAQDFARRAANAAPTLARHLLAAELSDDRNEKREWLGKAPEPLGPKVHPVDLHLAQPHPALTGTKCPARNPDHHRVVAQER